MSELVNGMVITDESATNAQFNRDNCFLVLTFSPANKDLYVQYFYCSGASSKNGLNENLRGGGSGKRLMLDAFIYMQQKHGDFGMVSVFPVPKYDPYQVEQIYKDEIDKHIARDEGMRVSFEDEVMYRSDYQHWVRMHHYRDLEDAIDVKIKQYEREQMNKLVGYYKSLGFSGDGPIYYGNFTDIMSKILRSVSAGTRRRRCKNMGKSVRGKMYKKG